jgi:AraC-like DNA-binding protein
MSGIRPDWLHASVGEIQRVTGLIELRDDVGFTTAREFVSRVPDPVTPVEERFLRGLLLEVCTLWAVAAHCRVHGGATPTCAFRNDVLLHRAWHQGRGHAWSAKRVFLFWATQYFRALRRAHSLPIHSAAKWIDAHSRDRVTDSLVARAVGIHVVNLRRRFKSVYGVSVHEYLQRLRLADVMRLLADGDHNARSALYASGWRSGKSLYAAAVAVTGMSFDRLRALPRGDWERRVAAPHPRAVSVPNGAVDERATQWSEARDVERPTGRRGQQRPVADFEDDVVAPPLKCAENPTG